MSEPTGPVPNLSDPRRKRLRFRSWHRGMKEMDLILGRFADATLAHLSELEVAAYEALLRENDPDLYDWITGRTPVPADRANPLISRIMEFHGVGTHD
ncbi:MAG: succinate dehydrogenase assembly factor 2 [Alphaproteobacteria bacterium]|nr:succinate dehydrogenase assembly factor 2 [Alphaproteobacteria bacterium]